MLPRCAGLLTGYLGKAEIGEAALRALERVARANARSAAYACDPVIGDVGAGSTWRAGVARSSSATARLPRATIATPKRLRARMADWRTGEHRLQAARRAIAALRARGPRVVAATSLQLDDTPAGALDILAGDEAGLWRVRTPNLPISVNGSGDVFAALFFIIGLRPTPRPRRLSRAASSVYAVVNATLASGSRELSLIAAQDELIRPSQLFAAEAV